MTYKDFFANKRVTVVGLGPHHEMSQEIKFLLTLGAKVTVVDPRGPGKLGQIAEELKSLGLEKLITGRFAKSDIHQGDILLIAPDVNPQDAYITEARAMGVRVETVQTLFLSLAPPVTVVGVMGTCGKTTVSYIIYELLKQAFKSSNEQNIFSINPDVSGCLAYLKKIKKDDIVITRIPVEHVALYKESRIVPHVAVYTTISGDLMPIGGSTKPVANSISNSKEGNSVDKRTSSTIAPQIFSIIPLQTYNNFIIASDYVVDAIRDWGIHVNSKILRTGISIVPDSWTLQVNSLHEKENISLTLRVAELFKIPIDVSKEVIEAFTGLKGRLELVKKTGNVDYYNDTASVTPLSTLAALKSLSNNRNVVLILGGVYKGDDTKLLTDNISQYAHTVILLPGSGTLRLHRDFLGMQDVTLIHAQSVVQAVGLAREHARKGDCILFSPGFAAGGFENSTSERGAAFVRAIRSSTSSTTVSTDEPSHHLHVATGIKDTLARKLTARV